MINLFKKKNSEFISDNHGRGILVFENTTQVIKAENILKSNGWEIKVMGPPPNIRSGCDLVIEFPLIEELSITRALSEVNIHPLQVVPVNEDLLEPVNLVDVNEYSI